MWTYHPDLLATPVPRYTSYPTAAEFSDTVGAGDYLAAIDRVGTDEPLSLYLHIPFCREICWYCGCNTGAANRVGRLHSYLDRLQAEVAQVARRLEGRGRVGRIAFGGGSPNAIEPERFLRLVDRVRSSFRCEGAALSVELDPRSFDEAWATALQRAGVSHASLGVQTFAPHVQAAIGRVQPAEQIEAAVLLLRQAGVGSINFDLMYGLPTQSDADLAASLEKSIALGADRLAVFGYAHVPHLIPRQRRIDSDCLPDTQQRFRQASLAYEALTKAGYVAIGFDHFARPSDPLGQAATNKTLRRNFQGFTDDQARILIGLGASAISDFPDSLIQNEKNAGRYGIRLEAGLPAAAQGASRTALDRLRARAIERLLCDGEANLAGLPEMSEVRGRLREFEARRLALWEGPIMRIPIEALPYRRTIAAALDPYRQPAGLRFSSAV